MAELCQGRTVTAFQPPGTTCIHELCPLPGRRMGSGVRGSVPLALLRPGSPSSGGDPFSTAQDTHELPEERPWTPGEGSPLSLPGQDASAEMSRRGPCEPEETGRAASLPCLEWQLPEITAGGSGAWDVCSGSGLGPLLGSVLPAPRAVFFLSILKTAAWSPF